jgi:hypothetical protein
MLGEMTFAVDSVTDLRDQTRDRLSKLAANDPARAQVQALLTRLEEVRARLVATREGGGITGEERVREKMGALYGAINAYDGRPSQSQLGRIAELGKELAAVVADFDAVTKKELAAANAALVGKQLEPVKPLTRADWEKSQSGN